MDKLTPAQHVMPAPDDGWRGADVADEERVDDAFIADDAQRVYPPLQPENDKLYPVEEA